MVRGCERRTADLFSRRGNVRMKDTVSHQKGLTRAGLRSKKDAVLCLNKPKDTVRGVILNKKKRAFCAYLHIYHLAPESYREGWGGCLLQINLTDGINRHFRHRLLLFYFNVPHFIFVFCFFALLLMKWVFLASSAQRSFPTLLDIAPRGGFMGAGPEVHWWLTRVCRPVGFMKVK